MNRPSFRQYIVGISAHVSGKDVDKGLEIGMDDFRSKPFTMKILQELDESPKLEAARLMIFKFEGARVESTSTEPATSDPTTTGKGLPSQQQSCLMAMARADATSGDAVVRMRKEGWDVTIMENGPSALEALKSRNWAAVVLDDCLPGLSGNQCVERFRQWESQNRVNRQDNLFIVCTDVVLSSPGTCELLPPAGFDGALDRNTGWDDLQSLMERHKHSQSAMRDGLSIVTR